VRCVRRRCHGLAFPSIQQVLGRAACARARGASGEKHSNSWPKHVPAAFTGNSESRREAILMASSGLDSYRGLVSIAVRVVIFLMKICFAVFKSREQLAAELSWRKEFAFRVFGGWLEGDNCEVGKFQSMPQQKWTHSPKHFSRDTPRQHPRMRDHEN